MKVVPKVRIPILTAFLLYLLLQGANLLAVIFVAFFPITHKLEVLCTISEVEFHDVTP